MIERFFAAQLLIQNPVKLHNLLEQPPVERHLLCQPFFFLPYRRGSVEKLRQLTRLRWRKRCRISRHVPIKNFFNFL